VDLRDRRGAFADRGGNAFGRSGAHIADRENAGQAGRVSMIAMGCL